MVSSSLTPGGKGRRRKGEKGGKGRREGGKERRGEGEKGGRGGGESMWQKKTALATPVTAAEHSRRLCCRQEVPWLAWSEVLPTCSWY